MAYDKHIDKTEEALEELRDVFGNDNVNRFLDGLEAGRINTEEKIIKFTNFIRTSDGLTTLEYARLKKLKEEGYIEKFATNCNKRYSTCHQLMNKMRSTVSRPLKTLEAFCEQKKSHGRSKSKRGVIGSSKMGKGAYSLSYWGLEQYKSSVLVLYDEIQKYMKDIRDCIELCIYINQRVAHIRNNPPEAHEIHQHNRENVILNNRSVINRYISMNADMENEILEKVEKWKENKKSLEEISAILYHVLDENEYNDWVISEEVLAARRDGITNEERAIWGGNKKQVMRCRVAYTHLDELQPEGQKDHIGGKFLALLYKWSETLPSRGLHYWHTYFGKFYKQSGGVLTPVKVGAVKMVLSKITHETITPKEVEDFNKRLDRLVSKYMEADNNEENTIKMAVNF